MNLFLSTFEPSAVLFSIGPVSVHWYGVIMAFAIFVAYLVITRLAYRAGTPEKVVGDVVFYAVIFGLVGARLYHVLTQFSYYAVYPNEIIAIWNGGQAIHGGFIGGLLVVLWFAWRKKIALWRFADIASLGLILGQAIGRFGNYFNQELYGRPTDLPWKIIISPEHRLAGYETVAYYHPAFLYEALANVVLFIVLYRLYIQKKVTDGSIFLLYILGYAVIRFMMEFVRIDPTAEFFGWLRFPQLVSLVLIVTAFVVLFRRQNI